ncbi:MAG TPA: hypothetical protein VFL12_05395 [Thermoanaerobaculia bacterium]|nr:hypothetical protein [Thermoanaerobaculia bacterium]
MNRLAAVAAVWTLAAPLAAAQQTAVVESSETTEAAPRSAETPSGTAPTYVVEWASRTKDTSQRLTLFADGVLVRKSTGTDGKTEMKKRKLSPAELDSYVAIFRAADADQAAGIFESGMGGDEVAHSVITVTRRSGHPWKIVFDTFAAVTPEAQRIRTAMEDLRDSFGKIRASPGDFPPDKLLPGTILRRRDGAEFRIVRYDDRAGVVELKGLDEPYSQFYKLDSLAATFVPP